MILYIFTVKQYFLFCMLLVVGIFLSIFLHELSHLIVIKIAKWNLISFKPYPHSNGDKFYLGCCYFKHNNQNMEYMPWCLSAPLYKAYIFFSFWSLMGLLYPPLFAFAINELADYTTFWFGYIFNQKGSDGFKLRYIKNVINYKKND